MPRVPPYHPAMTLRVKKSRAMHLSQNLISTATISCRYGDRHKLISFRTFVQGHHFISKLPLLYSDHICVTAASTTYAAIKFGLRCVCTFYFTLFRLILGFYSPYLKKVQALFSFGLQTCITSYKHIVRYMSELFKFKQPGRK